MTIEYNTQNKTKIADYSKIENILEKAKKGFTFIDRERIWGGYMPVRGKTTLEKIKKEFKNIPWSAECLKRPIDPEEYTLETIIDPICYDVLGGGPTGPKKFKSTKVKPHTNHFLDITVDRAYQFILGGYENYLRIILQAKPIGTYLFAKGDYGCVSQIKSVFISHDSHKQIRQYRYDFGVSTDGIIWIIIDLDGKLKSVFDIRKEEDWKRLREIFANKKPMSIQERDNINREFFEKLNDVLHGTNEISEANCLINSIKNLIPRDDTIDVREEMAQIYISRFVVLQFLYERGFLPNVGSVDLFSYIASIPDSYPLRDVLKTLFFDVLDTPIKERAGINEEIRGLPYINGSIFEKTEIEERNSDLVFDADILRHTIEFLNEFTFLSEGERERRPDALNPEVLGDLFEKLMTAKDRKGTGSYYTPREITRYISKNALHPKIVKMIKKYLIECSASERERSEIWKIKNIEDVLEKLDRITLKKVLNNVIYKIVICDPACGSGAFLLAMAEVLYDFILRINTKLGGEYTELQIKRKIISNLFGVDIKPRARRITITRLALWLLESYNTEDAIKPLPDIACNIKAGNSLIGYIDLYPFREERIIVDKIEGKEERLGELLKEYKKLRVEHKDDEPSPKKIKDRKNALDAKRTLIKETLDALLYQTLAKRGVISNKNEFDDLHVFHWGLEFPEVFDIEKPKKESGFNIIVGNPPYVKEYTDKKIFHDVKKCSPSVAQYYQGKMDYLYFFIELGIDILDKDGSISFITTNYWLQATGAKKLWKKILEETLIESLFNFNEFTVFEKTGQHNLIFLLEKKEAEKETENKTDVSIIQDKNIDKDELIGYFRGKRSRKIESFKSKPQNEFLLDKEEGIIFLPENIEGVCKKIKSQQNYVLKEKEVATGIDVHQDKVIKSHLKKFPDLTIDDGIFLISKKERDNLDLTQPENDIIKPFFTTNELKRYYANKENSEWIIYTTTDVIKKINKYPKIKAHLDKYKQIITSDFGHYGLHRAREERFFLGEKIISLRKTKQPSFSYVNFPSYVSLTFFVIQPKDINLKYLTGILNSKLIHFWLFYKGKREGKQLQIDKAPILSIPIIKVPEEQQKPLIELVDRMISLTLKKCLNQTIDSKLKGKAIFEKEIKEMNDKIDGFVYKLYRLTKEEISIIEEKLQK